MACLGRFNDSVRIEWKMRTLTLTLTHSHTSQMCFASSKTRMITTNYMTHVLCDSFSLMWLVCFRFYCVYAWPINRWTEKPEKKTWRQNLEKERLIFIYYKIIALKLVAISSCCCCCCCVSISVFFVSFFFLLFFNLNISSPNQKWWTPFIVSHSHSQ